MNLTCLQFCILIRAVCRREPGAWGAFVAHLDGCAICREWEHNQPAEPDIPDEMENGR